MRFPVNFEKFLRTPFSQNTSGPLLLHVVDEEAAVDSKQADKLPLKKKIPYNRVRKSLINFTWCLVAGSHVEKSYWY